jgi:hypothetical protein
MPKEIYPSSYLCDCGHLAEFSEGTIEEMKADSMRRRQVIADGGGKDEHKVVFEGGEMVDVICPKRKRTGGRGRKSNRK